MKYTYYKNLSYNMILVYKLFIWIENKYMKSLGDENVTSAKRRQTVNHVASSYAGFFSLKQLLMVYIGYIYYSKIVLY